MRREPKRDAQGRVQFDYYGVSPEAFTRAMRSGRYVGKKISRRGSFTIRQSGFQHFNLAIRRRNK